MRNPNLGFDKACKYGNIRLFEISNYFVDFEPSMSQNVFKTCKKSRKT